jgi:hypothetical protein
MPVNHVVVKNFAGPHLDLELALAVEAIRAEIPRFCAAWGLPVAGVAYHGADRDLAETAAERAVICVVSSSGDTSAFARHSQLGLAVFAYVDETVCRSAGEPMSRPLSHEFWEMLADPGLDRWIRLPDGREIAVEVSDMVNRVGFDVEAEILGNAGVVTLSDWVTPAWFSPGAPGPYDRAGVLSAPLEVAAGGYITKRAGGATVVEEARVTSFGRTFRRLARSAA